MSKAGAGRRDTAERMPEGFQPFQHPRLVTSPPAGPGWIHEIKFDGYRLQANVGAPVHLFTRNGHDWTHRLPELAADLRTLPPCILDCELCALDAQGRPDFSKLQAALAKGRTADLVLFVFDILWGKGGDQRQQPLAHRKAVLQEVLGVSFSERLREVDALPGGGSALLASAGRLGLEGVVSKAQDSRYAGGRQGGWLKSKCRPKIDVVVGGFLEAPLKPFGGLLVGVYEASGLHYVGSVRSGFGARDREMLARLRALEVDRSPFVGGGDRGGRRSSAEHWVRPELVAMIEIAEWTAGGKLRQASFKGFREDLSPLEVRRERPRAVADGLSGR